MVFNHQLSENCDVMVVAAGRMSCIKKLFGLGDGALLLSAPILSFLSDSHRDLDAVCSK